MTARLAGALGAAALLATPISHAVSPPRPAIVDLSAEAATDELKVSFRVESAFTPESLERIASGMEVEFRHRVQVLARRAIPLWPARVLSRVEISVTVHYDSLTHQYRLARSVRREVDGRELPEGPQVSESSTPSKDEALDWMTRVDALSLALPPADSDDRVPRLHVRAWLGRRYRFYLFPVADAAEAEQELTR